MANRNLRRGERAMANELLALPPVSLGKGGDVGGNLDEISLGSQIPFDAPHPREIASGDCAGGRQAPRGGSS